MENTFDRDGLTEPDYDDQDVIDGEILLTVRDYNLDGTLKSTIDPEAIETRHEYDAAGRRVTRIDNYVNGTPSGANGDDDVHTRFVYDDGLQTKLWVDVPPLDDDGTPDTEDQVTTYTYGTTEGTGLGDSRVATGHLLQDAEYPDAESVSFAYNAQFQQIWRSDQEGNIIETDYDDSGRVNEPEPLRG